MTHEWSRDVAIAPDGALQRIAAGINRPKKRAFGVLKTENEYVGFIRDDTFEIWERRRRTVHAFGRVRGRHGGSRVEVRLAIPARTVWLLVVFFVLYALVAAGIAANRPETRAVWEDIAVAGAGALVLLVVFGAGVRRQRSDLYAFVERLFRDVPG